MPQRGRQLRPGFKQGIDKLRHGAGPTNRHENGHARECMFVLVEDWHGDAFHALLKLFVRRGVAELPDTLELTSRRRCILDSPRDSFGGFFVEEGEYRPATCAREK